MGSRLRALTGAAMGMVLLVSMLTSQWTSEADQSGGTSNIQSLEAKRAALVTKLQSLAPAKQAAGQALLAAENAYSQEQAKVLAVRKDLERINARLMQIQALITAHEAELAPAKVQLAALTRTEYEADTNNSLMSAVLAADSFSDAMDRLNAARQVAKSVLDLRTRVNEKNAQILAERRDLQRSFGQSSALEDSLAQESNRLLALVATRDAAFNQASGPVRDLANQIAAIDDTIGNLTGPHDHPAPGSGTCGDHFAFGQCTWYVATRRCIPWMGNAYQWWFAAGRMGYAEGHDPEPGAVVVFKPGGDGASPVGHVGYVETVGPNGGVPAGMFKFSEMNFRGWDRVNYRTLPNNSRGVQGFIYGK